jgi:antitoxin HigA-1
MIVMHPGEYIKDVYLEEADISNRELASRLDVSEATISRILSGKSEVSADMAIRLERVLGRSAESWLAMQFSYSLEQLRHKDYPSLRPLEGSTSSARI